MVKAVYTMSHLLVRVKFHSRITLLSASLISQNCRSCPMQQHESAGEAQMLQMLLSRFPS